MEECLTNSPLLVKMEWSQIAVLGLIKLWREKESLYNPRHELYHNKHARSACLTSIAKSLEEYIPNVTSLEVETKINYLRSQYGRELLKVRESQRSGAGTDEIYVPTAYWFEELHFLKDFVTVRKGKSNLSYTADDNTSSEAIDLSQLSEVHEPTPPKRLKTKQKSSVDTDDILNIAKDYIMKLSEIEKPETAEQERENAITSFFRTNVREITDKALYDEFVEKMMFLIFEYKKKQKEIDNRL